MDKIKAFIQKLKDDKKLRNRVIICGAAAIVLIAAIIILCVSCGNSDVSNNDSTDPTGTTPPATLSYAVTVTDALGNPCSNVIVNFMVDGEICAMQPVNEQGVAEKILEAGEYTVSLSFTADGDAYHYDSENLYLTAENTSLEITVSQSLNMGSMSISAYSAAIDAAKDYEAYAVGTGCTYVTLDAEDRTYFIFTPLDDGVYEFSLPGTDAGIGYYGNTYFVQSNNLAEVNENGAITIDVSPGMVNLEGSTTTIVIGIDGNGAENCILSIQRIGEHVLTIEDYPWDIYAAKATISAYKLPDNVKLVDFDVTAKDPYKLVLNEKDGFYHLDSADGPVVYMKLGVDSAYLDSIQKVLESSPIVRYYFDADGSFISKESYSECLLEYIACMDENAGVYPLTEDLKYIIQQRGEYVGWWDSASETFLFVNDSGTPIAGLSEENAWLFLCCYGEEEQPVETTPNTGTGNSGSSGGSSGNTGSSGGNSGSTGSSGGSTGSVTYKTYGDSNPTYSYKIITETGTLANPDAPIELGGDAALSFTAEVNPGEYVCYNLYKISGTVLKISSSNAYVILNDTVYAPKDGVITLPIITDGPSVPAVIYIGNSGSASESFKVTLSYPTGSYSNPAKLTLGGMKTNTEAGDNDGYYFTYTAPSSGTLTISFESISIKYDCAITVYNLNTYAQKTGISEDVSIKVNKGDTIQIIIGVYDSNYKYPAATIKTIATLK